MIGPARYVAVGLRRSRRTGVGAAVTSGGLPCLEAVRGGADQEVVTVGEGQLGRLSEKPRDHEGRAEPGHVARRTEWQQRGGLLDLLVLAGAQ